LKCIKAQINQEGWLVAEIVCSKIYKAEINTLPCELCGE
jgi:hypothetical protein